MPLLEGIPMETNHASYQGGEMNDQKNEASPDPEVFARNYQLEALEKAKKENTIVFLETGSGKTLIAIMLLRSYAYELRKPSKYIAVFLVPTVVLVIQQAEAVEKHSDLKVRKLYGDMGVDFWAASTWKRELGQYEVFVMTPAILLNNLQHSFFKLDMIKLLIFDECHNARGRSPYACIMTEFYHRQLCSKATQLPRIFGMTASPIKSKGSSSREVYAKHIQELETLMHSKVYTVANEEVLAKFISYPTTKLNLYEDIDIPYNLFSSLADLMKSLKIKHLQALEELQLNEAAIEGARKRIKQLYRTFKVCLTELGGWLTLKAAEFLSCNETDILFWGQKKDALGETYAKNFSKDVFQVCSKCVPSDWCVGEDISADINAGFLTAKVECLIQSLVDYRSRRDLRCIIFVERVITAIALQALLSQVPQFSGWETTYMAGNHSGLQSQTRKDQMKIIDAFREGAVNIIIATQILEEGLDVQSCNLVIRFDPSATVCSFIQSRGRARMQGSDYLLLVRSGDSSTLSRIKNYLASGDIMREESVRRASYPCPPLASEMYDEYFYRVESTGALVTLSSAIVLIYLYCSKLPSDRHFKPSPRFEIDGESKMCTLHLPRNCPIQTICVHGPHNMLKKIACLEACKQLHEVGALTDYLLPEFNVEEGVDAEEIGNKVLDDEQYHYFPTELVDSWGAFSERQLYHCYLFCISQNFDYDVTPCTDIVLVVKSELDKEFTATGLQLEVDRGSVTMKIKYVGIVHLSADEVHWARTFQVTILRVLIDRSLSKLKDTLKRLDQEDNLASVSYLLLPSAGSNQNTAIIDWDCVRSSVYFENILSNGIVKRRRQHCSCSAEGVRLVHTSCGVVCKCMLVNSLVFTPHNGHIYCITGILYNMDGNSTMKLRGGEILTYKKYFQSRHGHTLRYESESLLTGRRLFSVQNCLRPYLHPYQKGKDSISATVELPPELCAIFMSPISLSTLRSFSFVPSIMHHIEAMFLAVGLKRQMNHYTQNVQVPSMKVLEAITTKKCQEAFSLESLETLGDSFLKYAASQKLFRENKHYHEGILSTKKEKMLSNMTLCKLGCNRKLPGFIRNECFDPKVWAIPGEALPGFIDDEVLFSNIYIKGLRQIKIKVIADVVEALIGAYLSTCGELSALLFMDWLGMKVDFMNEIPYPRPILSRPEIYINISHLQSLLNYSFRDASYLVEALTHGSYQVPEIPSCYQRLEFLGDSVLDYLITLHMFYTYPGITPGLLTDLRSASVNNECYAHAAVKTGLYKHLLHASAELHKQIILFVDNVDLSVSSSFFGWESETASPKALGDIIESIAGAILIDSGFNKEAVWNSIRPLLEPLVTPNTIKYNPVSELHKICQGRSFMLDYIKTSCEGVAAITAKVEADGMIYRETRSSANKKTSQRLAAKAVLKSLRAHIPGL